MKKNILNKQYIYYLMNDKRRDKTFDLLKVYAMLSVVLDHSLQHMIGGNVQSTQLYNWIFLSQMPIFMFISGYFALGWIYKRTSTKDYFRKLQKTIFTFSIPFFTYSIIVSILSGKNIVILSILRPDNSLWFLWTLMWMQIIMINAQEIAKWFIMGGQFKVIISIGVYFIGLIPFGILFLKWPDLFSTKLIIYYSVFFLFGYIYAILERNIKCLKNNQFKLISIPVLLVITILIMVKHPTVIYDLETVENIFVRFIGSFAVIILLLYIMSFAVKIKWFEKIASFGMLSLEMYYIHLLLLRLPFYNSLGASTELFIIKYTSIVCMSIVLIIVLKYFSILNLIIFGKS